jgi:transcriptional regulator
VYSPPYYREDDRAAMRGLMLQHPFALLVAAGESRLEAVHLPLLFHGEPDTPALHPLGLLRGHVARANPIWRSFDGQREALAVFSGPHAYVSPSWYASRPHVPTWNYTAVHAYGAPRLVEDADTVREHLHEMVRRMEAGAPQPWSVEAGGAEDYMERLLPGLVMFEMSITRLDGKRKLNQNRSAEDRAGVIAALAASDDSSARGVAELMRNGSAVVSSQCPVASADLADDWRLATADSA